MINKLIILNLLLISQAYAADAGQMVFDAFENSEEIVKDIKNVDKEDSSVGFLADSVTISEDAIDQSDEVDPFLPVTKQLITEPTERDELLDQGQRVIGDASIPKDRLIEANDRELFKRVSKNQDSSFSFYYVQDSYDVKDQRGIFKRTYVDDSGALRGGSLLISWEKTFYNSWINLGWGANFGAGLSQGRGTFVDGERSDTDFSLWTIPVELGLTVELPVSSWFDLAIEAGPGVLGLYQVRSDFENGAKGKRRRQVGTGYYAEAKFKLSLSNIFTRSAFSFFSEYGISNTTLDIIARMQDYGNFQDDITISGQSLGIGFTFDYL